MRENSEWHLKHVPVDRWRPLGSEDWYTVLTSPVDWEDLILTCLHGTWWEGEEACIWKKEVRAEGLNKASTWLDNRFMSTSQLLWCKCDEEIQFFTTRLYGEEMAVVQWCAGNARPVCVRMCVSHCCAPAWAAGSWCSSCWNFGPAGQLPCPDHLDLAEG